MTAPGGLSVALVGLGAISRFYARALERVPGLRLAALCDTDGAKGSKASVPFTRDHRVVLENPDIDAVIVMTPNDQHAQICRDALLAGKHVCVEKPMTLRLSDARTLRTLADATDLSLFTAFHRRYNHHLRELARRWEGRSPVHVRVRYLENIADHVDAEKWYLDPQRCGGGCVADNGPNAFDMASALVGNLEVVDAVLEFDAGIDTRARVDLLSESGARVVVELDWRYGSGELKDIWVSSAEADEDCADLLGGFAEFKGSLWHEYEQVVKDFALSVRDPTRRTDDGERAVALVERTYRVARPDRAGPDAQPVASAVQARMVKILAHVEPNRRMRLIPEETRCVLRSEIHEVVVTDIPDLRAGDEVERVGFLGFAEIEVGGVIGRGDVVRIAGRYVGEVIGFDDCHFPNHYNIVIQRGSCISGADLGFDLAHAVEFGR